MQPNGCADTLGKDWKHLGRAATRDASYLSNAETNGTMKALFTEGRWTSILIGELLSHQPTAGGDAAIQSNSGEISASGAFTVRPLTDGWDQTVRGGPNKIQELKIRGNGRNRPVVAARFRAEPRQLDQTNEFFAADAAATNSCHLANLRGKRHCAIRSDQRPRIRNKKLQQRQQRDREDDGRNHRDPAIALVPCATREGDRRADSETIKNVYPHASGSHIAIT